MSQNRSNHGVNRDEKINKYLDLIAWREEKIGRLQTKVEEFQEIADETLSFNKAANITYRIYDIY